MDAHLLDWLNLALRWAHVVAGMAWIGAAFYFFRLEHALDAPSDPRWVTWQAYGTWASGFALLTLTYYVDAGLYLVDPAVMPLSRPAAIGIGLAFLVGVLAIYEGLCRAPFARREALLNAALLALLAATAWGLTRLFGGRGAFIHYGAVLGTIMAGNVAHVAIPGARRRAQAIGAGREPDATDAWRMRQRSLHNTYLALPVVFAMLSSHYAMVFGHRHAWLALVGMTLAGALARAWFVARLRGRASAWLLVAAAACLAGPAILTAPRSDEPAGRVDAAAVMGIVERHCAGCHARTPAFPGLGEAPKGVLLDTPERVRGHAAQIHAQTVLSRAMPPGNVTRMTDEERRMLGRWYRSGAK